MATTNETDENKHDEEPKSKIPNDELIRLRAMPTIRLKSEIVDKQ